MPTCIAMGLWYSSVQFKHRFSIFSAMMQYAADLQILDECSPIFAVFAHLLHRLNVSSYCEVGGWLLWQDFRQPTSRV